MLSGDIKSLARTFSALADKGVVIQISGEQAGHFATVLGSLADQAEALENAQIPVPLQLNDDNCPGQVLRLARRLHRKGVRVGYPPAGGAA